MYFGDFKNAEDVFEQFSVSLAERAGVTIVAASYCVDTGGADGDAYVLFRRGRQLFEVVGGHCSCDSLSGQWEPTQTDVRHLRQRLDNGTYFRRHGLELTERIRAIL